MESRVDMRGKNQFIMHINFQNGTVNSSVSLVTTVFSNFLEWEHARAGMATATLQKLKRHLENTLLKGYYGKLSVWQVRLPSFCLQ